MYQTRFGFHRRPFPPTLDTSCYYPATSHENALGRLFNAFDDGEGMALLLGEAGTGKTLLCHCLLERFHPDLITAFLTNSHFENRKDLLQAILYDLSLPYEGASEQELRLRLTDYLLENYSAGKRALIIVDEAQLLGPDLLEEVRLLCNLEARQSRAVQILLVAQPNFFHQLSRGELASFKQRLSVRVQLDRLGVEEAIDYLLHHLRVAGNPTSEVFSGEALEIIARETKGIPRVLNQAAHQALLLCDQLEADCVDAEVALEALANIGVEIGSSEETIVVNPLEKNGINHPEPEEKLSKMGKQEPESDEPESSTEGRDVLAYRLFDPPKKPA